MTVQRSPLDDYEVRDLTLWETDAELPAFRAGWMYYRLRYELPPDYFEPAGVGWGQNERVAFGRGAAACKAVRDVLGPQQRSESELAGECWPW